MLLWTVKVLILTGTPKPQVAAIEAAGHLLSVVNVKAYV